MSATRFRKRPVVIEAMQLVDVESALPIIGWVLAGDGTACSVEDLFGAEPYISIDTPGGRMRACPGDWIIRGVAGEFYLCRDDIFEQTYEPVS